MTRNRWVVSLMWLGVIGCSGDPDSAVKLVPVRGTVLLNGKPMADASVSFIPEPGNKVSTAGGDTTGPEGNYVARYRGRFGLSPGKYKVMITPGVPTSAGSVSNAFKDDPFMAAEATRAGAASKPAAKKMDIKGEFDADVPEAGATKDFDVKATAAAVGASPKN